MSGAVFVGHHHSSQLCPHSSTLINFHYPLLLFVITTMFDILFGWQKASKCKKTIKRTQCRLRQLKNRSEAMVRYLRKDLAELIHNGNEETALKRVNHLIQDESLATSYELLDHFCEFILTQLSYIRRHKNCPDDINEAVSSLIFASARCWDIPELRVIRKLFRQRYGHKFETVAVELYPGNLVNKQLIENLFSVESVPDDLKYRVVDEIARDNCLQPKVLAIEYYPDWQQLQVKEDKKYALVECDAKANVTIAGSKVHSLEVEEIEYMPESDTSALVSAVQQYPPYLSSPMQKNVEEVEDFPASDLQNKGEEVALVPSSERVSFPPYCRNQNKPFVEGIPQSSYLRKRVKQHRSSEKEKLVQSCQSQGSTKRKSFNFDMSNCSLDQPCYCCVYNDQECLEDLSVKPKREIRAEHVQQGVLLGESSKNLNTYSCPSPLPKHVHPKLPDYDEIVANFTSLNRERLRNKQYCRKEHQLK